MFLILPYDGCIQYSMRMLAVCGQLSALCLPVPQLCQSVVALNSTREGTIGHK